MKAYETLACGIGRGIEKELFEGQRFRLAKEARERRTTS
jgi:hypothetical protein